MTQTTKILLKKSSVAGKAPSSTQLQLGELALNYNDGTLYYKDSTDTIHSIGENAVLTTTQTLTDTQKSTARSNIGAVSSEDINLSSYITKDTADSTYLGISATAVSAKKLSTSYSINGTVFNGTSSITTEKWGTARNITITDSDSHMGESVSTDGASDIVLSLPQSLTLNSLNVTTAEVKDIKVTHSAVLPSIVATDNEITESLNLETNAFSVGEIHIADGVTVTVADGYRWVII